MNLTAENADTRVAWFPRTARRVVAKNRHVLPKSLRGDAYRNNGRVQRMRFAAELTAGPRGTLLLPVPFDPDRVWSPKSTHAVNGTVDARFVRGKLELSAAGWQMPISRMWARDCGLAAGMTVEIDIAPEGAQRLELAPDIAAALEANQQASEFFDTLAQFYTKAYLKWIDSTKRQPHLRAERIDEVVQLLEQGIKQRPRG